MDNKNNNLEENNTNNEIDNNNNNNNSENQNLENEDEDNNKTNDNEIEQKKRNSQTYEKDQEILNQGIELPKEGPSNSIKILKKDKHGDVLSNISYNYLFKVSLIGDSSTGKTSILLRFIDNCFTEDTKSTIGVDFKIVSLELEPKIYAKMQIWDTCGSERFKSLTSSFIKTCSAFILVFDLTRPSTFSNIENWIKTIKENTSPKFFILVGNKCDLEEKRALDKEVILDYSVKHLFNYLEISAKNNYNIERMFKEVGYQLYMDIKKKEKENVKPFEFKSNNYSNIQVHLDNDNKNSSCC
jgi:small GTP-binding protein